MAAVTATRSSLQLRVLSGLHSGARVRWCGPHTLRVGSDAHANDVVLLDSDVQPRHLEVFFGADNSLHIRALAPLELQGEDLAVGTCAPLPSGPLPRGALPLPVCSLICLGATELLLQAQGSSKPSAGTWRRPWARRSAVIPLTATLLLAAALLARPADAGRAMVGAAYAPQKDRAGTPAHSPASPALATSAHAPYSWDQGLQERPLLRTAQRHGNVLFETQATTPAAPPEAQHLRGLVIDANGLRFAETRSGARYPLSADPDQGYTLAQANARAMVLSRRGQSITLLLD